eukprot:GEMP01010198.1.p1 GENE.GEMP01010198.1~~GEMP01010198.1.p1  ORF type:complete len:485 (+),score=96.76 GEMP01010198.1:147-1601(+)
MEAASPVRVQQDPGTKSHCSAQDESVNTQPGSSLSSCVAVSVDSSNVIELGIADDPNGKFMEDRVVAKKSDEIIYAAVFDGHGAGRVHDRLKCVDYVSENLPKALLHVIRSGARGQRLREGFLNAFFDIEQKCLLEGHGIQNGTTACVAIVVGRKLIIANLGDSKALLSRRGKVKVLTSLHRPGEKPERARIEKEGVQVMSVRDGNVVEHRLGCGLSVSRSFGDFNAAFCDTEIPRSRSLAQFVVQGEDPHLALFSSNSENSFAPRRLSQPSVQNDDIDDVCTTHHSVDALPLVPSHPFHQSAGSDDSALGIGQDSTERTHVKDRYAKGWVNIKPRGLSSVPEFREFVLQNEDEFVVIACDGVFDTLRQNQVALSIVRKVLADPTKTANDSVDELLRRCKRLSGILDVCDNLSAAVIVLKRPPADDVNSASSSVCSGGGSYKNSALHALRMKRAGMASPAASPAPSPAASPMSPMTPRSPKEKC